MADKEDIDKILDNKLELIQSFIKVKSGIKDSIKEDFILARLGDKDKEFVVEMTGNAYYGKKLIDVVAEQHKPWKWNASKKQWDKTEISEQDKKELRKQGARLFDAYMNKIYMLTILNRNVKDNHIIKWLAGVPEEEEEKTMNIGEEQIKGAKQILENAKN